MFNLHYLKNYKHENKQFKKRVLKASIFIAILIFILIIRLFNLQILQHKLYTNLSENNKLESLPIEPNRGLIYDRNGVLLAENLPLFSLNIIPEHVKNIDSTIKELQTIFIITPDNINQFFKTLKQRRHFEHIPLKSNLTQEEVTIFYLNQYSFPGVVIETQMLRNYPLGKTVATVLGYMGRINNEDFKNIDTNNYSASNYIGKLGIEKHYEKILHGKTGHKIAEVNAKGQIVRIIKTNPPTPGDTIYLTIDSELQRVAHDAMGTERGAVVAIDPNNGEILALVSHPSYDPNLFVGGIDSSTYSELQSSEDKPMYNRATLGSYPFASTIKPFIAIQALDSQAITKDFKISDPGWFKLENSNHIYRDWEYHGHGIVNITKAIIVSCDTFFYTISLKLGIKNINDILYRFGFGKKTNLDFGEENQGTLASPKWKMKNKGARWYMGDTVNSGIGQGFMITTPLQLANGVAAIAMRGERFQPHLLLSTKSGYLQKSTPLPPVTLKDPKNWDIIIDAMQDVIIKQNGTGHRRFGSNLTYSVAGKTGGAQLFQYKTVEGDPTRKKIENITKHLRDHNLFIAFAPVEEPKIAITVVTENSTIAPQVARMVLDYYLENRKLQP